MGKSVTWRLRNSNILCDKRDPQTNEQKKFISSELRRLNNHDEHNARDEPNEPEA
jgi:hypothetical protein